MGHRNLLNQKGFNWDLQILRKEVRVNIFTKCKVLKRKVDGGPL